MDVDDMHEAAKECRAAAAREADVTRREHLIAQAKHLDAYADAIELERLRRVLPP